jgi:site-specific DNA-cytosine methylase
MKTEYTVAYLFGGLGGGALGFKGALSEYMGKVAKFRSLCSIDADPVVSRNYEKITEQKAVCMDLFDKQQYTDFHSKEPSDDWQEASPWDIWQAFGNEVPDVIFTSPPCKGFSGLLPEKSAKSKKYQALNLLTIRGIDISLKACLEYGGELPRLILLENVPRITTRGKPILDRIKAVLKKYGFVVNDESHDCGEIGGLGQRRKRYLLIARNEKRMPAFVYRPEIKPLKTIGDVLGPLPMPGDIEKGGPLHKLPNLEWKTWMRLALIPAGGDWRDLNNVDWQKYRLDYEPRGRGTYGVQEWNEPSNSVIGNAKVNGSNGSAAVSDPRTGFKEGTHTAIYRISKWEDTGPTVTGAHRPNNGAVCVGDPRLNEREGRHPGVYRIVKHDETAPCVTGTRFGSGAIAIADPNIGCSPRSGTYGVMAWDETAKTVIGSGDVHAGAAAVADPRIPSDDDRGIWMIIAEDGTWHRPLTTYELAMLQGFPTHLPNGKPFQLEGCSDAKAREYVGNAVPPAAATGMANEILMALVLSDDGIGFSLSNRDVWVLPEDQAERQLVH